MFWKNTIKEIKELIDDCYLFVGDTEATLSNDITNKITKSELRSEKKFKELITKRDERFMKIINKQIELNGELQGVVDALVDRVESLIETHPNKSMFDASLKRRAEK